MSGFNEPLAGRSGIGAGPSSSGIGVDPYYRLLSISPRQRRFGVMDHFTLLGIEFGEGDAVIIENAADQRMQHLRTFRLSQEFAKAAETLLTEVSAARLVLLDEHKRAAYIRQLTASGGGAQPPAGMAAPTLPIPVPQPWPTAQPVPQAYVQPHPMHTAQPLPVVVQPAPLQIAQRPGGGKTASAQRPAGKPPFRLLAEIVGGGLAGIVLAALLVQFVFGVDLFGLNPPPPKGRPVASLPGKSGKPTTAKRGTETSNVAKLPKSNDPAPIHDKSPTTTDPADPAAQAPDTPATAGNPQPGDTAAPPPVVGAPPVELSPAAPVPPNVTAKKLAVPSLEERTRASQEIENAFGKPGAVQTAAEKIALARKLQQAALETSDPTLRFAMLQNTLQLFGTSGDIKSALAALDALAAQYQVDPLQVKLATLGDFADATNDADLKILGETVAATIKEALARDKLDEALGLIEKLRGSSRLQKDQSISAALDETRKTLKVQKLAWDKFVAAQSTLAASPDDGPANVAAGLWYASRKYDWPRSLACFAKAGDPAVKAAALGDLANPLQSTEQIAVADAWFDLAERNSEETKSAFQQRAKHWYRKALTALEGLDRARVAKRIQEIPFSGQPAIPQSAIPFGGHAYAVLPQGMSWHQAYHVCAGLGGHLAQVDTQEENAFLSQLCGSAGQEWYWIDGSDEVQEGDWRYSDGGKLGYVWWGPRQPQGGYENHRAFYRDGTSHDCGCEVAYRPICEWEVSPDASGVEVIDDLAARVAEVREDLLTRFSKDEGGPKTRIPKEAVRFQGHRYFVTTEKVTWHMARHNCTEVGGHLVRIESAEELQFVRNLVKKGSAGFRYWVDLANEYVEPGWRHSNGKLIAELALANGNNGGSYVAVATDGTYDDYYGGERRLCVCEWDE